MTDNTELKRLAETLISANSAYMDDECNIEKREAFHAADDALQDALPPEVVLDLIAENERLNAENKQLILLECYGGTAQAAINLLAERDQLKAEVEALRHDAERYRRMRSAALKQADVLADEFDAEFDLHLDAALGKEVQS